MKTTAIWSYGYFGHSLLSDLADESFSYDWGPVMINKEKIFKLTSKTYRSS
jgi:hypothetical protein